MGSNAVSCLRCLHYQVTWDLQLPYGCKAMGFKSNRVPSRVVYESSGTECRLFEPKKEKHLARAV